MTLLEGIDNSVYNTANPSVTRNLSFIISRATYGVNPDRGYAFHDTFTRNANLVPGAYAFGVAGDVLPQVRALHAVMKRPGIAVLDLEFNGDRTMDNDHAAQFIRGWHGEGFGKIVLYHSQSRFPHLGQDADWQAQWGSTPPAGFVVGDFWQYSGHPLDRSRFNGTLVQLRALAGMGGPSPRYAATVLRPTSLWNDQTKKWVYSRANAVPAGTKLIVRGARYIRGNVTCYPVVAPYMPAYYVPVGRVKLGGKLP